MFYYTIRKFIKLPPKRKFSKDEIVVAAVELVRTNGAGALTARNLGKKLGTSSSPIFTMFTSMEDVQKEVLKEATVVYNNYLRNNMAQNKYPPYKASGMGYISFAKEEKELFKLLFMRDRSKEEPIDNREVIKPIIEMIMKNTGLDEDAAYRFHMEMWIVVHGMATMIASNYLEWNMEYMSQVLTDTYFGLRTRFIGENK